MVTVIPSTNLEGFFFQTLLSLEGISCVAFFFFKKKKGSDLKPAK